MKLVSVALMIVTGCVLPAKTTTSPSEPNKPAPTQSAGVRCDPWGCGENGTRVTGTVDEVRVVVRSAAVSR